MKTLFLICFIIAPGINFAQTNFTKYYFEGAQNIDNANFAGGIEKLSKALEYKGEATNNYKIADAYIYRGYCRYMLKNYSAAISDIDEGIKLKPEYIKGYTMKTMVYLSAKEYQKCLEWCNKGLEKKANSDELMMTKSEAYFHLKKYDESKEVLFLMLENNPKNTEAIRYIASNFQKKHLWDSSVVYFTKALEINPLDFISYYDRGISKSYTKDFKGAKEDIEKAMQLDSLTKYVGFNNLGFFLKLEQNDFTGAIAYFNKAIELSPKFAYAYSNRGFAKLSLGDIKGAYTDLKKSIELDNTNSYALKNLGLINLKDNKKKEACENFKKAIELGYSDTYDGEVEKLIKENCK